MIDPTSTHRFADHRTPLLRNQWYVAALSSEITAPLQDRWIVGQSVLLYRQNSGAVAALLNRCPHRSFPLSSGRREGDTVVCGYHGLTFDADGRCVRAPSQPEIAGRLSTRTFPIVERAPLIWIWMGDPQAADPGLIPDVPWLMDPAYEFVAGAFDVECNYIRLHENVLDLTHLPFLHQSNLDHPELSQTTPEVSAADGKVNVTFGTTMRTVRSFGATGASERLVRHQVDLQFASPAVHLARTSVEDLEAPAGGRRFYKTGFVHAFTPIDQVRTRYLWCVSRDEELGNEEATERLRQNFTHVFGEDATGLALVEQMWARDTTTGFREISVRADRAGLLMREHIQKLAQREAQTATA